MPRIIDCHNHAGWFGASGAKIVADMDAQGIQATWLLSWEVPLDEVDQDFYMRKFGVGEIGMPFAGILQAAAQYPQRLVPGYCPDPRRPEALDRLAAAVEQHGVRVCGELKLRMMFDNPDALEMYRLCARLKLPVVTHLDYPLAADRGRYPRPSYWYGGGIAALERALRLCPQTVLIGHGPGFWAHISADGKHLESVYPEGPIVPGGEVTRLLRECSNLYADLSANSARNALSRDRGFGREFLLEFQDRLLFARDEYTGALSQLLAGFNLPPAVMDKILCGNALRLVPLENGR